MAIRIVGLKEYVNNPYSPQIELSNKVQGQSFSSEIRKLQNQEVYFGEMNKHTQSLTKRSWRNALETIKQVEEAFPEYTKSIIPATVQTMMALVGNKSGQFAFVANKTNPITVPHTLYFDRNNKQINAGSGWIKHYTLGTTDIKPSHSAADYKYWYVSQFVSGRLDDKAKTYYLYIKANKAIETAEFVLSENKIDMEQEAGFYHFLYATVNSEYDGERGIAQFNGFTEITGGQMVTNRIASGNGQQFIALYDDRIEINAHLQISDSNKLEFKQLVNPDLQSLESRLKQYSNQQVQGEQQARQAAIATAQTATEAYARAQSELTKSQAIAEANRTAGLAITAEQQARILQLQQNLQQAKTFAQQKVNELNIGGRNLLRETKNFSIKTSWQPYFMARNWNGEGLEIIGEKFNGNVVRKITGEWQGIKTEAPDILGEPVIISFWAKTKVWVKFTNSANNHKNTNGIKDFTEYSNNGLLISDNQWHRYTIYNPKGMCLGNGVSVGFLEFYQVNGDVFISSIKIEKGNKPTDWSPAPEDVENQIANINSDLETIRRNAARIEALENQNKANTEQRIGKLDQKTAFLNDTQIAGNVVATGTMIVGNTTGTQAGITGVGNATNEVRFWAGSEFAGRYAAPFRVLQDGSLYATNAHISGEVDATSGKIGNISVNSDSIGSFLTDIENGSSFNLTHDGLKFFSVYSEKIGNRVYTQTIKELEISASGITIKLIRDGNIIRQKTYDLT